MTGVAFLSAVPPSWHPPAPRACVCGRRSSTVSGRAQSGWTVGGGAAWFFRRPVAPAVARRAGGRWRMGAGAGAGEVGGSEDGAEGGDPDLDLSALRRRMEELEQGGKQDNDDDEDGDEPVLEVVVEEVIFGDANGADDEVMVLDLRDDDDDGSVVGKRGDDGEPIMGELRPPNSSENKEIATAYRDCDSLYIILFNAAANGEGLYSIQVGGMNVVLAFARMEEAGRYALALREQKIIDVESIVDIQVAELVPSELEEFCSDAGVRLGFVPADALLSPEHLHASDDATFSPFSSAIDPLRDGGMDEDVADEMRDKLNKLLGKEDE
ncbi:hypothetical protein BU14_0746s0002 [Porphyra umbilicalis]|uniref:DUF3110 domain-containing protein n=1 Tax=Porphyra umbilicalis TaxID=2786 RepID=A0A1X6NPF3_PORUM|nr:hypothetical protein BU14_0746s0002 [Porphyra umbilicalis]|eukprot:OSX70462.1 hypothetical protein BU14_0746s0002 [Porphyra umbilicalis]